jgi:TonB family protein
MASSSYTPPSISPSPPAWQATAPPPVKQKSRAGKIILIVGIILILLAGGIGIALFFGIRSYLRSTRSSTAYALAESTLRSSEEVKEKMGELTHIGVPIGSFKEEDDGTGYAFFFMNVEGSITTGQYVVGMTRQRSIWRIQNAVVKLMSGEEIKVVNNRDVITGDEPPDSEPPDAETEVNENQNTDKVNSNNSNQKPKVISGGVINGKATNLPQPPYPASAKAAHASGTVAVQVTVDEEGKVISANAISGHPLLRPAAVAAARQARFSPTKLAGQPVKVSGIINYNFMAEP